MASQKMIGPVQVLNQVVSALVQSKALDTRFMTKVGFLVSAQAGMNATIQALVSFDGVNFYDSGMVFPPITGSAVDLPLEAPGSFPYVAIQITPASGSAAVVITGTAKGQ